MEFWLFLLLFHAPDLVERTQDPLHGWIASQAELRDLECERTTVERARRLAPGQVAEPSARGDFLERDAVICRERLMPQGIRRASDEAILHGLRTTARDLAALVGELDADDQRRTWLVETFHPEPRVAYKVGFAVKNALLDQRLRVTDRAPTLAAGDIDVIGSLAPRKAYPLACSRYAAEGALGSGDALLAIVLRDTRETILHAGTCIDGRWRWLR